MPVTTVVSQSSLSQQQNDMLLSIIYQQKEQIQQLHEKVDMIVSGTLEIKEDTGNIMHGQKQQFADIKKSLTEIKQNTGQINCSQLVNLPKCILIYIHLFLTMLQHLLSLLNNARLVNVLKRLGVGNIAFFGNFILVFAFIIDMNILYMIVSYVLVSGGIARNDEEAHQYANQAIETIFANLTRYIVMLCKMAVSDRSFLQLPITFGKSAMKGIRENPDVQQIYTHLQAAYLQYMNTMGKQLTHFASDNLKEQININVEYLTTNFSFYDYFFTASSANRSALANSTENALVGGGDMNINDKIDEVVFVYQFCYIQLHQLFACSMAITDPMNTIRPLPVMGGGKRRRGKSRNTTRLRLRQKRTQRKTLRRR